MPKDNATNREKLPKNLVLIGNANVGKSVIFGALTGRYATVSNYPGTTVEITESSAKIGDTSWKVIDTPGINSLVPFSEDERVTRDLLFETKPDLVLQVADFKNLKRSLLLTVQLIELELPVILVLNMADEAKNIGIRLDLERLTSLLGVRVVETVATAGKGLKELRNLIASNNPNTISKFQYSERVEEFIQSVASAYPELHVAKRGHILLDLAGNNGLAGQNLSKELASAYGGEVLARQQQWAETVVKEVQSLLPGKASISELISRATLHPVWGTPIFFASLYLLYLVVGVVGAGWLVDLLENKLFGEVINPRLGGLLDQLQVAPLIKRFLVGEYGMITMGFTYALAIVLPVVFSFFIVFSLLEDSGYIPRLAVMGDRIMRRMGLNGKAVLPMVLGLGCATMATLTTRVLETKKERVLATFLLALGIPCSAQLGVIFGLLTPVGWWAFAVVFGVVGFQLFIVGFLAAKVIPGRESEFILELPPLRLPQLSNVLRKTWTRVEWFLLEAIPIFILGTFLVFIADETGFLAWFIAKSEPFVKSLLGLPGETTIAFILGFLRRDYGAVGLYDLAQQGILTARGAVVSTVVLTLFVPCIANMLVMIKERGIKTALIMVGIIIPYAILTGSIVNLLLGLF